MAYFSKKSNHHQWAYSTIEKKALALVLAVKHFDLYVSHSGGKVVVYTVHNPLTFLPKFWTLNLRVFRWGLVLQLHSFVVWQVAREENIVADTLSSMPAQCNMRV